METTTQPPTAPAVGSKDLLAGGTAWDDPKAAKSEIDRLSRCVAELRLHADVATPCKEPFCYHKVRNGACVRCGKSYEEIEAAQRTKHLRKADGRRFEMRYDGQLVCGMTIAKRPENDAELATLLREVIAMLEAPDVIDVDLDRPANAPGHRPAREQKRKVNYERDSQIRGDRAGSSAAGC